MIPEGVPIYDGSSDVFRLQFKLLNTDIRRFKRLVRPCSAASAALAVPKPSSFPGGQAGGLVARPRPQARVHTNSFAYQEAGGICELDRRGGNN
jgi:hypothetical protein